MDSCSPGNSADYPQTVQDWRNLSPLGGGGAPSWPVGILDGGGVATCPVMVDLAHCSMMSARMEGSDWSVCDGGGGDGDGRGHAWISQCWLSRL